MTGSSRTRFELALDLSRDAAASSLGTARAALISLSSFSMISARRVGTEPHDARHVRPSLPRYRPRGKLRKLLPQVGRLLFAEIDKTTSICCRPALSSLVRVAALASAC
jgi:hypothetical protein